MKDYKNDIETRQLQEDPIKQIIRRSEKESILELDRFGWPLTKDEEVTRYLETARGYHRESKALNSWNSALLTYPQRFDQDFQVGMDAYRATLIRYLERDQEKRKKDPNREMDRLRMNDKYIPHTIEAGMDHYFSSDEELEEEYER